MKNNVKYYLIVLTVFLFISLAASAQYKVYTTVSGDNVSFVTGKVVLNKYNQVVQGVLWKDFPFTTTGNRGILFQGGHWVRFDANAKVYDGYLAHDHPLTVRGNNHTFKFKKGTRVRFDNRGLLLEGTTATSIGMTLSDGRTVRIPAGTFVKYDSKGRVTNYHP